MDLLTPHSHRTIQINISANHLFEIMHTLENLKYFKNDKLLFWELSRFRLLFFFIFLFFFKCMPPKYSFNNQLGKISLIQNLQILILFPIFFLKRKKDLQQNSHNIDSYDFSLLLGGLDSQKRERKSGRPRVSIKNWGKPGWVNFLRLRV